MAINGLNLVFHSPPPLSPRDCPPRASITSNNQVEPLSPFIRDWLERVILTKNLALIPHSVHFSRMFNVPKPPDGIRPVFDLCVEYVHQNSTAEDGAFRQNLADNHSGSLGLQVRYNGRLPECSNLSSLPEVLLFCPRWNSLHVFAYAFWLDNGALGLLSLDETHQKVFQM